MKEDAMTATQKATLTIDELVKELLEQGTIAGCRTLQQVRDARLGLLFRAQQEGMNPDSRTRQLAGIALRKNITIMELGDREHANLVRKLREALMDAIHPEERSNQLINEIMSFDAS